MTDRLGNNPVLGVIALVAMTVILAAIVGTIVVGPGQGSENSPPGTPTDPLAEHDIERVIDEEAGVVCYFDRADFGGMECLPLNETRLTPGGSP